MSKSIEIEGKVETCTDLETFPSGFSKRSLVILTDDKYPQTIPVEFVKDKAEMLTGLRKGQQVTAHCNVNGREHNGKYYISLSGWKLDKGEGEQQRTEPKPEPRNMSVPSNRQAAPVEDDDQEIPF